MRASGAKPVNFLPFANPASPRLDRVNAPKTRLDIQVLRALAILAVVLYHFVPDIAPNGYLGVDIFFVISGFLITGLLIRELESTHTIKLKAFFARRARRLLPAALLTVVVSILVSFLAAPKSWWSQTWTEGIASIFYAQNWLLLSKEIDYLQQDRAISPFQHFWSLSIEEQFYIFWPLLLLLTFSFLKFRSAPSVVISILGALSLWWFLVDDSAGAFFNSFGRVWEFAIGALIAMNFDRIRSSSLYGIAGWVLMLSAIWVGLGNEIVTAMAVVGAGLALIGSQNKLNPGVLLSSGNSNFKPLVFIGDLSYSLYLWHWPVLIILPWFLDRTLGTTDLWVLVALTALLSVISKYLVEDPIRYGRARSTKPADQLIATSIAMVGSTVFIFSLSTTAQAQVANSWAETEMTPALSQLADDKVLVEDYRYRVGRDDFGFLTFDFGLTEDYVKHIALVGDSHARQYFNVIDNLSFQYGWKLTVISKSACSLQNPQSFGLGDENESCLDWNQQLFEHLEETKYDLIINSNSTLVNDGFPESAESFVDALERIDNLGMPVLVITDNPKPRATDQINDYRICIERYQKLSETVCAIDKSEALSKPDRLAQAAKEIQNEDLLVVNPVSEFCPDTVSCPPVINGTAVYRDNSHVSVSFAEKLSPMLSSNIRELLGDEN